MSDAILRRRRETLEQLQRDQLVEGFALVADAKGYAGATIADIVRAAHVSKSTFYEHFADKEALYLHLHGTVAEALAAGVEESMQRTSGEPDWRRRIRDRIATYLDTMASNPAFLTQIRIEPTVATPGALRVRREARRRFAERIVAFTEELATHTPDVSPPPEPIVAAALVAQTTLVADAAEHGPEAVRELEETLVEFWIRLLRAA